MHPLPFIVGRRTVYEVTPNWHSAEIIGIRPPPLALFAYRKVVTDEILGLSASQLRDRNLRS
jgi:hypothetical protein